MPKPTSPGATGPSCTHADTPDHFRRYERTTGWNAAINQRQFGLPPELFRWPDTYRYPDLTYRDELTFTKGGLTFELHHGRGETDDATWTYVPELRLLHPGDLFIWAIPNAGNPQKVQRYVSDWADALRAMAATGAEVMLSGHGLPIFGAGRIVAALTDTADLLDSIERQTLELMNLGVTLDRVIHEVTVPERFADLPYLQPVYDHPQFIVRNVWRRYGGWHDGEPDHLLPAPRAQQAAEWVELAGGIDRVLARAARLADDGDLRMASHLVEHTVLAAGDHAMAHELRTSIYQRRADRARVVDGTQPVCPRCSGERAGASRSGGSRRATEHLARRPDSGVSSPEHPTEVASFRRLHVGVWHI
ncbi:MAG: alkyl sulfatase dimerization domain-containing protein [Ilumatobacteraceae bacterium]